MHESEDDETTFYLRLVRDPWHATLAPLPNVPGPPGAPIRLEFWSALDLLEYLEGQRQHPETGLK